jgi:FMN phosphatase YigB (HAD superfamily)
MLRSLKQQGTLPPLGKLFTPSCLTLSYQEGVRTPSPSLYRACVARFEKLGIAPGEVLHVGTRLKDDLAVAKSLGLRTALYAADKTSLRATPAEMKDEETKPDRLVTDLSQVCEILGIG